MHDISGGDEEEEETKSKEKRWNGRKQTPVIAGEKRLYIIDCRR
jgi:hypothetical protein